MPATGPYPVVRFELIFPTVMERPPIKNGWNEPKRSMRIRAVPEIALWRILDSLGSMVLNPGFALVIP